MTLDIDVETRLCAVIGNPVEHSLSPCMHNAAFRALGLNYVYLAFKVENVHDCLRGMRALPNFRGMSVTIPHKVAVMEHLDEIDDAARFVGCANTITNNDGRLIGTTTDGPGAFRALLDAGVSLDGKRVLFAGSGGAVRSVAFMAATAAKPASITILGRTRYVVDSLCQDISDRTGVRIAAGSLLDDLDAAVPESDVIIQGTPIGMYPHTMDETCIPSSLLAPHQVVFDMVYRPYKTRLLREAEMAGCKVVLGIEMLVHQAVVQFERWTGATAPYTVMRESVLKMIADSAL
jgi:shikimate dehydrogenase